MVAENGISFGPELTNVMIELPRQIGDMADRLVFTALTAQFQDV